MKGGLLGLREAGEERIPAVAVLAEPPVREVARAALARLGAGEGADLATHVLGEGGEARCAGVLAALDRECARDVDQNVASYVVAAGAGSLQATELSLGALDLSNRGEGRGAVELQGSPNRDRVV